MEILKSEKYTTSYVEKKFNVSRQTLYNWIKRGEICNPNRDWRNWREWNNYNLIEIENLMRSKREHKSQKRIIESDKRLYINNRRYLGSKQKLIPFIISVIKEECGDFKVFSDIFGGTGVVADSFNSSKKKIIVNDLLYSNYLAYQTWFGVGEYNPNKVLKLIKEFNNFKTDKKNYVSKNFGGAYFSEENAIKIGAIREEIERISNELTERERAILITSLLYAMDKVANTCGHYDAYRKKMDSYQNLELLMPYIQDNKNKMNEIYRLDANELVRNIKSDITYIDTPYNSRQYSDAYHLPENIAEWKKPKVEGVAKKMVDREKIKSKYCTNKAPEAFDDLIQNIDSKFIIISYNNMAEKGNGRSNAKISDEEILNSLRNRGTVNVFDTDFQYFTTGKTKLQDHKERLFVCKCN